MRVFDPSELCLEDRGWTRGRAHLSFDDVPTTAPGYLALGAVPIVTVQSVDAGRGYAMHPHADVETLLVVLDGAMSHEDSLGNRDRVGPGELAILSAGAGIEHAEMADDTEGARAFMFWLRQRERGGAPGYVRRPVPRTPTSGFVTLASGRDGADAPRLRNDAAFCWAVLPAGGEAAFDIESGRRAYVAAIDGDVTIDGVAVPAGGRALLERPGRVSVRAEAPTPVAVIDLPR